MPWTVPQYSKTKVNWAGSTLIDSNASTEDAAKALEITNNWRSSHSFPLNTFQVTLRNKSRQVDPDPLISQRIKRRSSIEDKLRLIRGMKLARMQDIGGCRSVVSDIAAIDDLVGLYESSQLRHELMKMDDYLRDTPGPKASGYRGVHLVYRYQSDRSPVYNDLRIEIQIRTRLQHAWATAVETTGTFIGQALKSSQGEAKWLRFFALMGSELAFREGTPAVPGTPTDQPAVRAEVRTLEAELSVVNRLRYYSRALQAVIGHEDAFGNDKYFLLQLDATAPALAITGYPSKMLDLAVEDYEHAEAALAGDTERDVVLVSVDSISTLQRAYPNYFADTTTFLEVVSEAIR